MANQPAERDEDRVKAAELYVAAQELEARGDYEAAIERYEDSLRLRDDPAVEAALFKLLATIGPA